MFGKKCNNIFYKIKTHFGNIMDMKINVNIYFWKVFFNKSFLKSFNHVLQVYLSSFI